MVPETKFPFASFRVMVMEEVVVPSFSMGLVPVIVEVLALAAPGMKVVVPPLNEMGEVIESVFVSA